MNNKEFISELAKRNGQKMTETQRMVDSMIAAMGENFLEGNAVQLPNFGTLEVKKKLERIIVNPSTGLRMLVPPKLTLAFKPVPTLKDKIRRGGEGNG